MGIFGRISDIISANLNDMVEGFEDPQKMLKQAIREMETTIEETRQSTAQTMADEKLVTKELEKNRQEVTLWAGRAQAAIDDGNEPLARKAITRKQEHEKIAAALEDQRISAQQATLTCQRQLQAMQAKLAEAKRRLCTLMARKRTADLKTKVSSLSNHALPDTTAFAKFDRMREKVEQAEAQADALRELGTQDAALCEPAIENSTEDINAEVEAELIALKNKGKKKNK